MAAEENREPQEDGVKEAEQGPTETEIPAGGPHWPSEADEDEDETGRAPEGREAAGAETDEALAMHPKANTLNRVIARFIDTLFTLLLARLPGYIGFLAGITYIGIADGLLGGRSLGKRIIGLRVLYSKDGRDADFRASILRNSPIGLLYLLFYIPIVGWAFACLGLGFELLLIIGSAEGKRLGDEIAATVVADEIKEF